MSLSRPDRPILGLRSEKRRSHPNRGRNGNTLPSRSAPAVGPSAAATAASYTPARPSTQGCSSSSLRLAGVRPGSGCPRYSTINAGGPSDRRWPRRCSHGGRRDYTTGKETVNSPDGIKETFARFTSSSAVYLNELGRIGQPYESSETSS